MVTLLKPFVVLAVLANGMAGCAFLAGAGAGYAINEEMEENDGEIDISDDIEQAF